MRNSRRNAPVVIAVTLALACGCLPARLPPAPPPPVLTPLAAHPPLVDDGDPATLAAALRASAAYFARLPRDRVVEVGGDRIAVAAMQDALASFATFVDGRPAPDALARELDRRFRVYGSTTPTGVLYTGYYPPTLDARRTRDARFRFPVLGRPADLVSVAPADFAVECPAGTTIVGRAERGRLVPYPTRAEIEANAAAIAPVVAWVDDPVALFFLQIQGTGRLAFPDGSNPLVGFAASNGRPYVSIGKLLVDEGRLSVDEASMDGIRRWIAAHPDEGDRVLHANPRYVFFAPLAGEPIGSLRVPVTGGRTIATDPAVYPPGVLAFIRVPATTQPPTDSLSRLVLNQDSGAAIRGPAHVDIFFGEGPDAETHAGRLHTRGDLYVLVPRS
jgi:membrane-bound lytic murein transglycosylase A